MPIYWDLDIKPGVSALFGLLSSTDTLVIILGGKVLVATIKPREGVIW